MKKLNLVILCLTVIAFSCSRTISQSRYYSNDFKCECPNLIQEKYQLANEYGTSQLSRWYSADDWKFDFQNLRDYWNLTNVGRLPTESIVYRMTVPDSSTPRTVEVQIYEDSTFLFLSFYQDERVYKSRLSLSDSIGRDFNSRMDALFWQQAFRSEIPAAVADGSHLLIEGTRKDTYKSVFRNSGELVNVQEIIEQFDNLAARAPIFECEEITCP